MPLGLLIRIKFRLGTIVPVVLRTTFSFENCKPDQTLRGQIAQDVPLANGSTIRKGSLIEGHIVEVTPAASGNGAKVSIRFDKLYLAGHWVPLVTNLRAIAGFMTVLEASIPEESPSEGTPYEWLPTTQIGGDTVYGARGPVMSGENTSEVIGKSVSNGVLARVSAKEGTRCRGAINGNDYPQALWVFSTDACGILWNRTPEHRSRWPNGTPGDAIVLASETHNFKLRSGDGLLLRVD